MSNTPKIRFAGFTESWTQRKLGEMMNVTSVKRIHQSDWTSSGVRFLRARDIVAAYKHEEPSDYLYITEEKYNEYSALSGKVKIGDLLVTGVGTIGVPMLINNDNPLYFKDGNIIWFQNENKIHGEFLYYSFAGEAIQNFIKEAAGTGTVGTYTIDSGKKTPIVLPDDKSEQQLIGTYFSNLDNLIALQQRKYEKLAALKAACLDKMFPKNGSKVPEMRFAGFAKSWEQSKFKDSFEFLTNNTLSRADLDERNGSIYNLHYGDILVKFGETLNLERDSLPYISDKTNASKTDFLQNGDVIITDTAEDDAVGKCTEIVGASDSKIVSGLHTIPCRPYKKFAKGYLGYFMNSPVYHDQLVPLMQGTKVTSVSKSALQSTMIYYPSNIKEQTLIGEFFMGLNNLITLQEQKVKKLKQLKQAMLHNMFV